MLHVPSLVVGSLTSGSMFLLTHQQLSRRESLSWKWAMAQKAETELREQMKKLRAQIKDQKFVADANDSSFGTKALSKYYKQTLDDAQKFFGKED
mmetsp:Transcript_14128/g.39532  ORF Transcript_14128/g.39532 Transcript_14128/m.39532 type:complete len:95 (-) Transcript_14128:2346-2630(-)